MGQIIKGKNKGETFVVGASSDQGVETDNYRIHDPLTVAVDDKEVKGLLEVGQSGEFFSKWFPTRDEETELTTFELVEKPRKRTAAKKESLGARVKRITKGAISGKSTKKASNTK